jgi:hypothetical protein
MLHAVGYERKTNELEVLFKTGDRYRYENVPLSIYLDLLRAQSKGKYMQEHVIGEFSYYRMK